MSPENWRVEDLIRIHTNQPVPALNAHRDVLLLVFVNLV